MFKLESQGFAEVQRLLEDLPRAVSKEKTQVALHLAATPTAEMASSLCIRGSGDGASARRARQSIAIIEQMIANPTPLQARALAEKGVGTVFPQLEGLRAEAAAGHSEHLADNIEVFDLPPEDSRIVVVVGYLKRFFYGHFLEWGTSRMAARPFLRPAWDATKGQHLDDFGRHMWAALRSALPNLPRQAA